VNAIKSAGTEFNRHESFGRKRAFEKARLFSGETKPGIVVRMPDNNNDMLALFAQHIQALSNQSFANSPPLMFRQHGYRSQCRGGD